MSRILITSALPYVNNVPHLGNLIGSTLSADVYARYERLIGNEVMFVCGTDEYGTATETKAVQEGKTCQEICDFYHEIHQQVYHWFNISFNVFGRTSTLEHTELVQTIYRQISANGYFEQKETSQMYCLKCERFLSDRFVEGTCPHCSYFDARGDQCDQCQKLLDPVDLINPRCKLCNQTPIQRQSSHLFFNLKSFEAELAKTTAEMILLGNAKTITESWLKKGLEDRCMTRDMSWGVKVPGFPNKVFYVWFDAPIGYISITPNWKNWWLEKDVTLVQFMGKDNVAFHTLMFPASLLATKTNYKRADIISATDYLLYEEGKFSKSRGLGIFGPDAIESGIEADLYRYYLICIRPEGADTTFKWDDFLNRINGEFVAKIGNFAHRILSFIATKHQFIVEASELDPSIAEELILIVTNYHETMKKVQLRKGLEVVVQLANLGNSYFHSHAPWASSDLVLNQKVLSNCFNLVVLLASLLSPFTPTIAEKILKSANHHPLISLRKSWGSHTIGLSSPVIKPLDKKVIATLKEKYGKKK